MNKFNLKAFILSLIISIILFLGTSGIGGVSFNAKLLIGTPIYFLGTYYWLKSPFFNNKFLAFSIVALFPITAFIYFNIFKFQQTKYSFPSSLFLVLGIIAGYFFYKKRLIWIPVLLGITMLVCFGWLNKYFINKVTYNTYDGSVLFKYPNVKISDSTAVIYTFSDLSKIYILDFWTSSCGVCFHKFPIVDSINKLADKSRVEIIAVNIPIRKEKKEDNYTILNEFDYGFKKLFAESISTADSFGVEGYPTTIVLQNQQIIFRGDFEDAIKRFKVLE